jgi:hypothetical protein
MCFSIVSKKKKKTSTSFHLQPKNKKQSIRKLAVDLASSSAPPFEGLRAVYRALGAAKGVAEAPSLEEALSGGGKKKEEELNGAAGAAAAARDRNGTDRTKERRPKDPALAARLQALQDASDQRAYDASVADLTARERAASRRSGAGLSLSLAASAPAAGLALAASAGTGYAAGFVAARALFSDDVKHPAARYIGGLIGLVAAMAVEAGLVVVRAVRAENEDKRRERGLGPLPGSSSSSSSGPPLQRITRRLTEAELAAEAEVAATVVAGAATAVKAGAEAKASAAARAAAELAAAEKDSEATATADEAKKQR